MTKDIEWGEAITGPEIKALGLPGDTPVKFMDDIYTVMGWTLNHRMRSYHLPADHPAYFIHRYNKEHGTNFVYWAGGDNAPDDWNGSYGVIIRNGQQIWPKMNVDWNHTQTDRDIIGYTKRVEPQLVTEEASEPEMTVNHAYEARMQAQRRIEPEADTFTPCERTVRLICDWFEQEYPHSTGPDTARKLFLPKPDRAEELANEWMNRAYWPAVVEYTRDLIERGEIKG